MFVGAFLAAYALEVVLLPNAIIDGGIIGVAILLSKAIGNNFLYPLVLLLNLPFILIAYKTISKTFVLQMFIAVVMFVFLGHFIGHSYYFSEFHGETIEVVVIGGLLLGLGVGLIIRVGGCLDGTEILGLLINKRYGITVGSVVLFINCILFSIFGLMSSDWHPPIQSLITFLIMIKIMDMVIVGLDEMKSVMIFSDKPDEIADELMHTIGLGLTFIKGQGGYTGEDRKIVYLIAERLQLSEVKALVQAKDPDAFIAIENLHEIASRDNKGISKKPN